MSYVDTGPILERDFSARAGLGWIGKHTGLINRNVGSWLFLGEIITSLVLEVDRPTSAHCGSCERCLKACPTEAFVGPYELDARRCISYLTIENKDEIPRDLRPLIGGNVFGCDICQDVCPWNRKAETTTDEAFSPLPVVRDRDIASWLKMDSRVFKATFKNSSFERTKRRGFFRNIAVVLGNQGDPSAVPALVEALDDPEPLVRAHVAWALGRLGTLEALNAIRSRSQVENEPSVATELRLALEGSCQT
jgi:epoxyqueuosine reductase